MSSPNLKYSVQNYLEELICPPFQRSDLYQLEAYFEGIKNSFYESIQYNAVVLVDFQIICIYLKIVECL